MTFDDFVRQLTYGEEGRESSSLYGLYKKFDGTGSFGGWAKSQSKKQR